MLNKIEVGKIYLNYTGMKHKVISQNGDTVFFSSIPQKHRTLLKKDVVSFSMENVLDQFE